MPTIASNRAVADNAPSSEVVKRGCAAAALRPELTVLREAAASLAEIGPLPRIEPLETQRVAGQFDGFARMHRQDLFGAEAKRADDAFAVGIASQPAVRVCLGAPRTRDELAQALRVLAEAVTSPAGNIQVV